ncbi:replication-relaxation family protein [Psychrobacillus sp. FSL K6-1267]|uniref:replication-relaxation family protein n=1 Tax=Psychrobacillus sp. FSL K6-1267 TaxID=2921543 RepID=UPI0030F74795
MKKNLSPRDEEILLLLKKFDFLTRDQLNKRFNLGKVRNTNRVLFNLSDYLMTVKEGHQTVYYLSKIGREYVGCDKIRKKGNHVQHTIMRNQLWLYYGYPRDWQNEMKVILENKYIIVDAMFTRNNFHHFLEVDNLQTMKENREKIKRYIQMIHKFRLQFGYFPTIVWLTTSEVRRKQLLEACKDLPSVKVYTLNEIK